MAIDKKQKGLFIGLCVLFGAGLVFALLPMFRRGISSEDSPTSVTVSIPDAEVKKMADSKAEAMRGAVSLDKYFDELGPEAAASEEDMSLVSSEPSTVPSSSPASSGGSAVERVFGTPAPSEAGSPSPSSSHHRSASGGRSSAPRTMTSEERLAYDRQRAEMVRVVLTGGSPSEDAAEPSQPSEEPVHIDLSASSSADGIISTLDDGPSEGVGYGVRPFRCMFVRDQKLVSGQRVSLRLLEDLPLDGVTIPANTHLSAICKIGERLELSVRSLEMGGRIVQLSLEAYDCDGLPGIYCPETASSRNSRKAADEAVSTAGQTFGGLVGDIASTVIRTGASIAKSATGEVSVAVVSGYEFYLVKSEKR